MAMAGYSGGGMATAWAAALAPDYAPELDIAVMTWLEGRFRGDPAPSNC
jgi:hypothetical protein